MTSVRAMTPSSPTTPGDKQKKKAFSKEDFEFGPTLGEGAYSRVVLTTFIHTGKKYATKVIEKKKILEKNQTKTVKMEKQVLHMMDHPNIIKLFCTYQDKDNLYFALELAPGGELFSYLSKHGPFTLEAAKFYTAEIVNALEYMHSLGIIHRDLKPENIILSKDLHAKVTDFGTAKIKSMSTNDNSDLMQKKHKQTFCGTAQFVSPEVLKDEPCFEGSDLWALGCIVYQFLTATHPFKAESEYLIFQKILRRELSFPPDFPETARDIVDKLLQINPDDRLGTGVDGYKKLKSHPFFNGIDFDTLSEQTPPPIQPQSKPNENENQSSQQQQDKLQASPSQVTANFQQLKNDAWKQFLNKNENIIYSSPIIKRVKLSVKKRQLVLTDRRFFYVNVDKMKVKGGFALSKDLKITKKNDRNFVISIPGRDYFLEDMNATVDAWVKAVEQAKAALPQVQAK